MWGERGWTCLGNRKIRFIRTGTVAQHPQTYLSALPKYVYSLRASHRVQ